MIINENILNDLSTEDPAGIFLRYDNLYDEIKFAMQEDDPRLPQGVWETDLKKADWKKVQELCENALINNSKDFQLIIWLLESCIERYKWNGLTSGLDILLKFSKKFWEIGFPKIGEDLDYRLSPFIYLCNILNNKIIFLPLSAPQNDTNISSVSDFIKAKSQNNASLQSESFIEIRKGQDITEDIFFIKTQHYIQKSINLIEELDSFLSAKTSNQSPSFNKVTSLLELLNIDISNIINSRNLDKWDVNQDVYIPSKKEKIKPTNIEEINQQDSTNNTEENDNKTDDPLAKATIEQAYDAIYQISLFLEEKQPQSVTPSLLKVILFLKNKSFTEITTIKTNDGEPILSCISKICEIIK